ncbi:PA2169 family four-helix-bundle protein [Tenacibaculum tangerinum]|uniref:PA2169 family four-helix-bundle protein n=1 Tax=Tenacibaculum tangerinum TaxID=3038772 RepID=A0ABY8L2R1_9FLAO|nr:PA2169 family four-helix-bundle protein [Tenacibaculum tangerinum]WGH75376.1 PA2169 family four-helix-bundle protein [Tenacibaculum tangerinum]
MGIFSESTENKFNDLLEKAYDAEKGFKKAAENVENSSLQRFFNQKAEERQVFRSELRNELRSNGLEINEEDGSVAGTIHRAWMDTKAFFSFDNEESMLEEVRNGEKAALEDYEDLLEDNNLPTSTVNVLRKQRNAIESSYNRADYLEDIR